MAGVKNCLYILILFCCVASCGHKAVTFNDELVNIQKSVLQEVKGFSEKMQYRDIDSLSRSSVKTESDQIIIFINNKIKEAESLEAPKDGKNLQSAFLNQFRFEKDIVGKIGRLADSSITKEEKIQIETEFLNSQEKAKAIEADIHNAQEAFAKEHKFKLENK
jgi:hypothetical protein